jgi:Domain of unknown function (DUF1905)
MEALNTAFQGTISKDEVSGWACVLWQDSVTILGTGKTVRVACTVDELPFEVTLMPSGKGCHFLPLKAASRKLLNKDIGDSVSVCILSKN